MSVGKANANTRHIEMNNEIVLMRRWVRQARICVINKLIREARMLRTRHGDEKQKEKHASKADRIVREVFALKKVKDDEISKFGITDSRSLQEILQDPDAKEVTRATARVAFYKSLRNRIDELKEKFPDYEEFLCHRKKKRATQKQPVKTVKTVRTRQDSASRASGKTKEHDGSEVEESVEDKNTRRGERDEDKSTKGQSVEDKSAKGQCVEDKNARRSQRVKDRAKKQNEERDSGRSERGETSRESEKRLTRETRRVQEVPGKREKRKLEKAGGEQLHPSWEAKRKMQEAMKQGFQGKKIVFNDD